MNTKNRVLLPLSALLVAALIAGLTWAVSSRQSDSPAVLRLLGSGGATTQDVGAGAMGAPETRSSQQRPYKLTGELPAGQPDDTPVYAVAGPYDTSRLSKVLNPKGLTTDKAAWWWSPYSYCADTPTSGTGSGSGSSTGPGTEPDPAEKTVSSCGVSVNSEPAGISYPPDDATSSEPTPASTPVPAPKEDPQTEPGSDRPLPAPSPEPTTPAMTDVQARTAAKPVFDAVGLSIGDAIVRVTPYGASVWLNPIVNGLPTAGYTTRVELDRDREISWASGFLGDLDRGDNYPVITAQEAFDNIEQPAVRDMMCRPTPDGKGCAEPPQQEITGATLGLVLRQTADRAHVLVPAWLFAVKDWDEPLGQIAIPERFLGDPEPTDTATKDPGDGQTEPGTGADGGGSDGSVPPPPEGKPSSVEPAPPASPKG